MTATDLPLAYDARDLAGFCERAGIRSLAVFGSALRDDFTPASDLDLLVDYHDGCHPGLLLFRQQDELSRLLHRPADLHTSASLSPHFRDEVLASAIPL
jgi:predicted nucleotidyltransferase